MKTSLQSLLFPVFITLLFLILQACQKDKISEQLSDRTKSEMIVKKSKDTLKTAKRDCGKFVIIVLPGDGFLNFEP